VYPLKNCSRTILPSSVDMQGELGPPILGALLIFLQSAGGYDDMQGVQSGGYKTDKGVTRKCEVLYVVHVNMVGSFTMYM